jgi:hypothetical protein
MWLELLGMFTAVVALTWIFGRALEWLLRGPGEADDDR